MSEHSTTGAGGRTTQDKVLGVGGGVQTFHLLVSGNGQTPNTSDGGQRGGGYRGGGWGRGLEDGGPRNRLGCEMKEYLGCHVQHVSPADAAGWDMGTLLRVQSLSSRHEELFFSFRCICMR